MSTLATADLGPSDDEADGDFVPQVKAKRDGKRVRDDSDDSDDDSDDEPDDEVKKLNAEAEEAAAAERKRRAAEAFRLMQEEARSPTVSNASPTTNENMVEVKRPRRFAGETIFETVMLPKDHPDAIKYADKPVASESTDTPQVADTTPSAPTAPGPPLRRPIRKRPRQSLEAMAAAIDAGKKMTTLEKSQIDWNSHMSKETKLAEEVAQNRRSGGFLEKQAFLDRVGERQAMNGGGSNGRRRRN